MTSKSKVEITTCSDEDIPTCFRVMSQSFGHDAPFLDAHFPHHDTEDGRARGTKRLLAWKKGSEGPSTFIKAVVPAGDGQQEVIVGVAVWTWMKEPPSPVLEEVEADVVDAWPDEDDREYMRRLWRSYVVPRSQAVIQSGGAGVYVLELLAVHPGYQRLGAGTGLVRWGTKKADEQGLDAVVEGTPVGRHVYEKCGFRAEIEEMEFEVGEQFANRRKPPVIFLKRKINA